MGIETGPDYEQMYDGINSEEQKAYNESAYTPRDISRLTNFEHIIRQSNEIEERLNNNTPQEYWWVVGTEKKRQSLLWKENWRMVNGMRTAAFNMYSGHTMKNEDGTETRVNGFVDDLKMKEAADAILKSIHQEKLDCAMFEKNELEALWDNS